MMKDSFIKLTSYCGEPVFIRQSFIGALGTSDIAKGGSSLFVVTGAKFDVKESYDDVLKAILEANNV